MHRASKETEHLRKIVESFPRITITVLGDMVADEFVFGEISRVSREAPVLILSHRERTVVPGGAANAVNNLADLGVNVLPVGILGNDEPGRLLLRAFRHKRIPITGIQRNKSYATVTKTRVLAGLPHTWRLQVGQDWARLCSAGNEIINRMKLDSLVITRGRDGMVAFNGNNKPVDIPISGSDEVTDMTGAGDTVIATFTAALATGASTQDAA